MSTGGYTLIQITNALINYAQVQGVSNTEIIQTVQVIKENQPLIQQLLQQELTGTFKDNKSNISLKGLSVTELSISYAIPCPYVQNISILKGLYLGGSIKYLHGYSGYIRQKLLTGETSESSAIFSDFRKNLKQSYAIGIDLGLLWDKRTEYRTKVDIVAKNINSPKFCPPEEAKTYGEEFKLDPQVRIGVAIWPLQWITVASDLDLTKNSTFIPGYKSQMINVGCELNILSKSWLNLALRAGMMKNLAMRDSKLNFTAGLGGNILHFGIDISGAMCSEWTAIEKGINVPANLSLATSLSLNF